MTMEQPELSAIKHAAFGVAGYRDISAEQLATTLSAPVATRPTDLQTALGTALGAGAAAADFAAVWQYPDWLGRLESALVGGLVLNAAQAKALEQGANPDLLAVITAQDVTDALAL